MPVRLAILALLLVPVAACGGPGKDKSWAKALKISTDPAKRYQPASSRLRKGPGLISGKENGLVVYQDHGPGSADPTKPRKVRR